MKRKPPMQRRVRDYVAGAMSRCSASRRRFADRFPRLLPLGESQTRRLVAGLVDRFRSRASRPALAHRHPLGLGSRRLNTEPLEERRLLSVGMSYVDDSLVWDVGGDVNSNGIMDTGDVVIYASGETGETDGLIFGSDAFDSIQSAIDATDPAGTVNVAAGTYVESLTVNKTINLLGGNPADAPVVDGTGSFTFAVTVSGASTTASITGFEFVNWLSGGIDILSGHVNLDSSSIDGTSTGMGVKIGSGSADITNSIITQMSVGLYVSGTGTATVHGSDLSGNLNKAVVNQNASATVDASGNYWGTEAEATVLAHTQGKVDFTPFLTQVTDTSENVGFQGDLSDLAVTTLGQQTGTTGRIQEGVDLAAGGAPSVVFLHNGLYKESNTTIDKPLLLQGESRGGVVIAPAAVDDHDVLGVFDGTTSSFRGDYQIGLIVRADNVTVADLTIDGNGNSALVGDSNFRTGIILDNTAGTNWNNFDVQRTSVADVYYRGVEINPVYTKKITGTGSSSGHSVTDSSVDGVTFWEGVFSTGDVRFEGNAIRNVSGVGYLGAALRSYAQAEFVNNTIEHVQYGIVADTTATITGNTIDDVQSGIIMNNHFYGTVASQAIIQGNHVTNVASMGMSLVNLADGSLVGGPNAADRNTIDIGSGSGVIGMNVWWNPGGVTIQNNELTVGAGNTGIEVQYTVDESKPVVIFDNVLTGDAGAGTGVLMTPGVDKGNSFAVIKGNQFVNLAVGVNMDMPSGNKRIEATIGGNEAGESNTFVNNLTAIRVHEFDGESGGYNVVAHIVGNLGSIHGNAVGIDVDGGSAVITGNAIYDNGTGILVRGGGSATLGANDFDDDADNATDVRIDANAGTVTLGDGNQFAGDNYFLDNRSSQSFDLTAVTGTTYDALVPGTDDFALEDKMFHGPDSAASGVITWVAGNLFVTAPGTGESDETIQNAVDVAASGDTINVQSGEYAENVVINKSVTLAGEPESSVELTGRITLNADADDVVVRDMTLLANSSYIILVAQAGVEDLTLQNVTLDGQGVSTHAIHTSRDTPLAGAVALTNLTVQNMAIPTDSISVHVRLANDAQATLTGGAFKDLPGHVQFRGIGENPTATVVIEDSHWTGGGGQGESALELYGLASVSISGGSMTQFVAAPAGYPVLGVNAFDIGSVTISDMNIDLGDGLGGALTGGVGINLHGVMNSVSLTDVEISNAGQAGLMIAPASLGYPANIPSVTVDATSTLIGNGTAPIPFGPFAGQPYGDVVVLNNAVVTLEMDPTGMVIVEDDPAGNGEVILTAVTQHADIDYAIVDDDFDYQTGQWFFFDSAIDEQDGWYQFDANAFSTIQAAINAADAGDTIHVQAGLYEERIVIAKPLTLLGATADVNKNGYTVPADYAWIGESVISNPTPEPTALVQVVDIQASDVTFKGFVVESLNAPLNSKNDSLVRVDAKTGTRERVIVENNVIGPNTNSIPDEGQTGSNGRMGLYLSTPTYPADGVGIIDSRFAGNKIFGAEGNGNNVFIWGAAASYNSSANADYSGTVIEDNEIFGSHRSGIEIAGGVSNLTIRNNEIHGNSSQVAGLPASEDLKYGNGILIIRIGTDKARTDALGVENLTISGNYIHGNEKNGIYVGPMFDGLNIENNVISDNGQDGIRVDLTEAYYGTSAVPVLDRNPDAAIVANGIAGNGGLGVQLVGEPTSGYILDASGNWWGDVTPSGVAAMLGVNVDYTPWLNVGDIDDDPTNGFQGDSSYLHVDDDSPQAGPVGRIQEAVDLLSDGLLTGEARTVEVAAGQYIEQIEIDKAMVLQGQGIGVTTIQSPAVLAKSFTIGSNVNRPIVYVHDADDVTLTGLTVDGLGLGNDNYRFIGIAYHNAGGLIDTAEIAHITNTPFSGAQHGVGIYAYAIDGIDRNLEIVGVDIHDFQKNAMALIGQNLAVDVHGNTVAGIGDTGITAQNGIQISSGARGAVWDNVVRDIAYTGTGWDSTGILAIGAGTLSISGNEILNAQMGINVDTAVSITDNIVTGHGEGDWGIVAYVATTITGNTVANNGGGIFLQMGSGESADLRDNIISGVEDSLDDVGLYLYGVPADAAVNLAGSQFASDVSYYVYLDGSAVSIDATQVWLGGKLGSEMDLSELFEAEDRVIHATDDGSLGFIRINDGNVYVTEYSGSIQRGIDVASDGDTIWANAGTYTGGADLGNTGESANKSLTLRGALTLTGDLIVGDDDAFYPGFGAEQVAGQVIVDGNVTINGVFDVEIEGVAAGIEFDQLMAVNGTVTLGATATLDVSRLLSFGPPLGYEFVVVSNDGADAVNGTFFGLEEGDTIVVAGIPFTISYMGGTDNNDVTLTVVNPAEIWANDTWIVTNDIGDTGLSPGDVVMSNTGEGDTFVEDLIYGVNAFSTIQDAVTGTAVGGTVHVLAGTYAEQVTITKSLTLLGAGADDTTVQAPAADRASSVAHDGYVYDYLVAAYATSETIDVRIEGFTIDANGENKSSGTDRLAGVFLRDVAGATAGLVSSTVEGFAATPDYESWGVRVFGNSDLAIDHVNVSDFTRDGITATGGVLGNPNVAIGNNIVTGSAVGLNGILIGYGATGTVTGNTVTGNLRSAPWAATGIYVYDSDGVEVSGNEVTDNFYGIFIGGSNGVIVSGNTVEDNVALGIQLSGADDCMVSGNTITGTLGGADKAIGLNDGSIGNVIENNEITLPTSGMGLLYGLHLEGGSAANAIQNNTITGGTRAIQIDGGNDGTTTTITGNTITNPSVAGIFFTSGVGDISGNTISITENTALAGIAIGVGSGGTLIDGNEITLPVGDGQLYAVWFNGADAGDKTIENNTITGGKRSIQFDGGPGHSGTNTIIGNVLDGASFGGIMSYCFGNFTIARNDVTGTDRPMEFWQSGQGNIAISNNRISSTAFDGINAGSYAAMTVYGNSFEQLAGGLPLRNSDGSKLIDASGNWWGSSDAAVVNGWMGLSAGAIDYSPWLHTGADNDGGAPGFEGDFSYLHVDDDSERTGSIGLIQEAIDMVAGSTVMVHAGTYQERLLITGSLNLLGEQAGVDARGRTGDETIITEAGLSDPNPNVLIEVASGTNGVVIDGFTLIGDPTDTDADTSVIRAGGTAGSVDDLTIANNVIDGRYGIIYKAGSGLVVSQNDITANKAGIAGQFTPVQNIHVANNDIKIGDTPDLDASGVYFTGITGTNTFNGNRITGFTSRGLGGSTWTGATISGNTFEGNRDGISIWGDSSLVDITGNQFIGQTRFGASVKVADMQITGNTFDGNATALDVEQNVNPTTGVTISGNTYLNMSGKTGILVVNSTVAIAETITDAATAVSIVNGAVVTIADSTLTGNGVGISVNAATAVIRDTDLTGNTTAGIAVANGATVDAGTQASAGNNVLTGYLPFGTAYAIENLNLASQPDVQAEGNNFGSTVAVIVESVLWDDTDDASLSQVIFTSEAPTVLDVFVDDDWQLLGLGATVDPDGNGPLTSATIGVDAFGWIQQGVDGVAVGGTVTVHAGTYNELVTVAKTVNLRGAGADVDARTRDIAETIVSNAGGGFDLKADNVILNGFTVQDATTGPLGVGVYTRPDHSGYQILNNIIKNNTFGLYLHNEGTTQALVQHNLFANNNQPGAANGQGIYSDQRLVNAVIDENQFVGHDVYAIDLTGGMWRMWGSATGPLSVITISDNEISGRGICVSGQAATVVPDGMDKTDTDLTITGNVITGPGNVGIYLLGVDDATISGNQISGIHGVGPGGDPLAAIYVYWCSDRVSVLENVLDNNDVGVGVSWSSATVESNQISNSSLAGIFSTDYSATGISGNTLAVGNAVGILVGGGTATITGNAIYDNGTGILVRGGGSAVIEANNFDGGADNATDLRIDADAGTVTLLDGNQFAGGDYFIDNRSAQSFDLTGLTGTTYEGLVPGTNDFAIEDKMFHGPDSVASGVITWVAGNLFVTAPGTSASDETIQNAIDVAKAGDTINLDAGEFAEGPQIVVDKNLTIVGQGMAATTVKTTGNTGGSGDSRGWWLVKPGVNLDLSGMKLDGSGYQIYQAIRHQGTGSIDGVAFENILYPNYAGVAIAAFNNGAGDIDVTNSTFANIGRVGVLYYATNGTFANNVYTGKGTGDWLDYALDISAGAVVVVEDNTITGNRGVASSDGSVSGAIMVTSLYGGGTTAQITGSNVLTDNSYGVLVGYNAADTSVVTIDGATITGNDVGVSIIGATTSIANVNFDGATDNMVDLELSEDAGVVTLGGGNQFAGDNYFIDNRSSQSFDLTALTGMTYEGLIPGEDDFAIEDKMFHGPDDVASGVITWVAGKLFVTAPGTGESDETIQNAIDVATSGDIVNVQAGAYVENVVINKSVTVAGESESSVELTGRITLNEDADGVVVRDMTLLANSSYIILVAQAGVEDLTLQNVTLDGQDVSIHAIHSSEGSPLEGAITLTNLTVQNMAVPSDALSVHVRLADEAQATLTGGTFKDLPGHVQFRGVGANPTATVVIVDTHWTGGGSQGESALELYGLASVSISGGSMTEFVAAPAGKPVLGVNAFDIGSVTISGLVIDLGDGSGGALTGGIGVNLYGVIGSVSLTGVEISNAGQAGLLIAPASLGYPANIPSVTVDATSSLTGNGTATIQVGPFAGQPYGDVVVLNNAVVTLAMDPTGMVIVEDDPAGNGQVILTAVTQHADIDYALVDDDFNYQAGQWFFFDSAIDEQDGWYQFNVDAFSTIQAAINAADAGETVYVQAGTYNELVSLNKSVTVAGAGQGATVLELAGLGDTNNRSGVNVTADNVTIRDLTVRETGTGTTPYYGINVGGTAGVTIENLTVQEIHRTGLNVNGAQNITLTDVQSLNNGGAGIFFTDVNGATLSGLHTAGNAWAGMTIGTKGQYYPQGTSGIVFAGTNVFEEVGADNGGLQFEGGTYSGGVVTPAPITWSTLVGDGANVTIPLGATNLNYALSGLPGDQGTNQVYAMTRFYDTLDNARDAAEGDPAHILAHDRFIRTMNGIAEQTNYYVYDVDGDKMSVQAAINDAKTGDTVNVAAGTYVENVTVNKMLALVGAGSNVDGTVIQPTAGNAVTLTAGGISDTERLLVEGIRVTAPGNGIRIDSVIGHITFDNVAVVGASYGIEIHNNAVVTDLVLDDVTLANNNIGFRVATAGSVNGLTITGGHLDNNTQGMHVAANGLKTSNQDDFTNVAISGTTFNGNSLKGIYVEKLNDAVFDAITVDGSGTSGAWASGIDINLKYGEYKNITIQNSTIRNSGAGDAVNGVGLTVKARNDGGYSSNPATLTNVVIRNNFIENSQAGIRLGEPGKNNVGPTNVLITENSIVGNELAGLDNQTQAVPDASGNWWGDADGPTTPLNTWAYGEMTTGDKVIGEAAIVPWLTDGTDVAPPIAGFQPGVLDTDAPAVSDPDLTDESDTGASNTDNITANASPVFIGTAELGATVALMEGETVLGTATADPVTGGWSITSAALADGEHLLVARATDQAGNVALSGTLTIYIDTAAPMPDAGADQNVDEGDQTTLTGSFTDVAGYGPYAELWRLVSDTNGQTIADVTGDTLVFTPADNGVYVFSYTVTDVAGNTATDTMTVTVANVAPTITSTPADPQYTAEGSTFSMETITFSDPGFTSVLGGTEETFSYTINWGDGHESVNVPVTGVAQGSEGVLTTGYIDANHVYADNGTYTVTVTVQDDDGGIGFTTFQVVVANVAPVPAILGAPATSPEGTTIDLTSSVVDPGADTFTYAWSVTKNGLPYDGGTDSTFSFTPDDDAQYVVTLTVTDDDGDSGTTSETIVVTNVAPTIALSGNSVTNEGAWYTLTLGSVTDPGDDTVMQYVVFWGDNTSTTYTAAEVAASNGVVTHYYDDNVYNGNTPVGPISVTLVDDDGAHMNAGQSNLTVNNVPPTALVINGGAVNEGSPGMVIVVSQNDVSAADRAAGYTYGYDFNNDGDFDDPGEIVSTTQTNVTVPASYLDNNPSRTIRVEVRDKDNGISQYSTTITVNNVAPVIEAGPNAQTFANTSFTRTGAITDPGNDVWTGTVNYGDGTPTEVLNVVGKTFLLDHAYTTTTGSPFTVTVTVTDGDSAPVIDTFQVAVIEDTLRVIDFTTNASGFDVQFSRAIDLDVLNLYDGNDAGVDLPDLTLVRNGTETIRGSVHWDATTNTLSFVKTGGVLPAGNYTLTLLSSAEAFVDTTGELLDGNSNGTAGDNYSTSFTVAASTARVVYLPDFARAANQEVNIPATGTELPIKIDNANGVTAVDFDLVYDPALLTVNSASLAAGLPPGWSLTANYVSPGYVRFTVSGTTALVGANVSLISLDAAVPSDAPYRDSQIIRIANLRINEDGIASKADYAFHKVAHLGDVMGNRVYTSGDAAFISMVVVDLYNGFDAYPTTDPVIIGDVTGDGTLSGQDVSDVARKAVGLTQPNIPDLPPGTTLVMPEGPDPLVSIATGYVGNRGETVGVAVEIDDAANLFSVDLTIGYDTVMLGLDTSGISVSGGLLDGWSLNVNLMEETGQVRIGVFSAYALTGGSGEIVTLDFEVAEDAPAGTTILDVIGDWLNGGGLVMSSTDGDFTVPVGVTIDGTTTGQEGTPVALSSTLIGEQGTVAYDWNVYKNGSTTPYATSTDSSIEFTPDEDAVYNVTLTVTDGEGNTGTDVHAVLIDNVAPSADANGPYAGYQGSYITLDASSSTDPGNDIVSYLWDLDGDGEYDDASGPVVLFRAVESGIFNVAVKVIDDDGAHGIDSAQLTVSPTIPGDANGSGTVDNDDMKIVASNWGRSGMTWADGDFNKDGLVNAIDAAILAAHFGATISPPETQPVEPVIADTTPFIGPLPVGGASSARQPIQPADRVREQAMQRTADAFELPEELLVETTCESATAASDAVFADEYGPATEDIGSVSRQAAWSNMVSRRQSNRRDAEQLGRAELAVDLLMARR